MKKSISVTAVSIPQNKVSAKSNVLKPLPLNIQKGLDLKKNNPKETSYDKNVRYEYNNISTIKASTGSKVFSKPKTISTEADTKTSTYSPALAHFSKAVATNAIDTASQADASITASKPRIVSESKLVALYVGDLDEKVTNNVLLETFSRVCSVASVRVCYNTTTGDSLGYGYVNFFSSADADKALETLNYTKILSSEIRIMPSIRDQTKRNNSWGTNVFFSNLPEELTTRKFYETFQEFGGILSCKLNYGKKQGFILFKKREDAAKVVDTFNKKNLMGSTLYVGIHTAKEERDKQKLILSTVKDQQKVAVFVKNLPINISEPLLQSEFEKFGQLISIFIKPVVRLAACWALITFKSLKEANDAITELNGKSFGDNKISCSIAKKKSNEKLSLLKPSNVICFKNLPIDLSQNNLLEMCSKFGTVKSMVFQITNESDEPKNVALVEMKSEQEALAVSEKLYQTMATKNHVWKISMWHGKSEKKDEENDSVSFVLGDNPGSNLLEEVNMYNNTWSRKQKEKRIPISYNENSMANLTFDKQRPWMIPISPVPHHNFQNIPLNAKFPNPQLLIPNIMPVPNTNGYRFLERREMIEKTISDFKNIIQNIVRTSDKLSTNIAVNNIQIITDYILEVYWRNDIIALSKQLTGYKVNQKDNSLIRLQLEKAVRNLRNLDLI
ncbi:Pes4 protein [Saccharomycopsis crataegensis]|uniref:Pes4 protein n=1 Tax=Saccharomycopsis crataegensis TaxID=43959 RepID=A0AAV5QG90_9ASCO|nr:Pes4 protein [Saccharomycopsis crataegensis]